MCKDGKLYYLTFKQNLLQLKIPFHLLLGQPRDQLPLCVTRHRVSAVVCDFSPLRVPRGWVADVASHLDGLNIPLVQVLTGWCNTCIPSLHTTCTCILYSFGSTLYVDKEL